MKQLILTSFILLFMNSCFNPIYDERDELSEYHIGKWQIEAEQKTVISSIKKDKVDSTFDFIMEEGGLAYRIAADGTTDYYHWTFSNAGEQIAISYSIEIGGVETLVSTTFIIKKQDENNQKWETETRDADNQKVITTWVLKRI